MSKAKRHKNTNAQANKRAEMRQFVELARARQQATTGHPDMTDDPLGRAFGGGHITRPEYDAGRRFEELMTSIYGQPHAKAVNLNPSPASRNTDETAIDIENQKMLSIMRNRLRKVHKLSIVTDMCYYHEACQNRYSVLKQGLAAIVDVNSKRLAA